MFSIVDLNMKTSWPRHFAFLFFCKLLRKLPQLKPSIWEPNKFGWIGSSQHYAYIFCIQKQQYSFRLVCKNVMYSMMF